MGYSSGQGNRPSAKECTGDEDEETPEGDQENQGYEEFPEETEDPFQHHEEEEEQEYQEEVPPTETIKSVLAAMENFALERQAETGSSSNGQGDSEAESG